MNALDELNSYCKDHFVSIVNQCKSWQRVQAASVSILEGILHAKQRCERLQSKDGQTLELYFGVEVRKAEVIGPILEEIDSLFTQLHDVFSNFNDICRKAELEMELIEKALNDVPPSKSNFCALNGDVSSGCLLSCTEFLDLAEDIVTMLQGELDAKHEALSSLSPEMNVADMSKVMKIWKVETCLEKQRVDEIQHLLDVDRRDRSRLRIG